MNKFLLLILVCSSLFSSAQVYQSINSYGYQYKRLKADSVLHLPADTVRRDTFNLPGIAAFNDQVFLWSTIQKKWIASSTYSAGYGLTLGASVFKVDSTSITSLQQHQKGLDSLAANYKFQNLTVDPTTPPSGKPWLNTTGNKFKVWMNGIAENVALESWASSQFRTGNYIFVDANNPSATDTRGSLSKYSLTSPWRTIAAAHAASSLNDILYIRSGTYTDYDSTDNTHSSTLILDNATWNASGTRAALYYSGNSAGIVIRIYLNNSTITNTGLSSDPQNTAALVFTFCDKINIIGNSKNLTSIKSTNGWGVCVYGGASYFENTSVTSTNSYAVSHAYGANIKGFSSDFTSTNYRCFYASALDLTYCSVSGTIGVYGNISPVSIVNSSITGTAGKAMYSDNVLSTIVFTGTNSKFIGTGDVAINWVPNATTATTTNTKFQLTIENCKFQATGYTLDPVRESTDTASFIRITNAITNAPLFSTAFRSYTPNLIKESNTRTNDSTTFFGVKVGVGVNSFVGGEQLRVGGDILSQRYIQTQQSAITATATTTIDLSLGSVIPVTMAASITTLTLSNPQIGQYFLKLTQDATGGRTVTWPATVKWSGGVAPTLSAANKTDLIILTWDGTNYFGQSTLNY